MTREYQISSSLLTQYQRHSNRIYSAAERLLEHSIQAARLPKNLLEINILVPCAGSFPSYAPFLKILAKHFRYLKKAKFLLVDTDGLKLEIFKKYQASKKIATHLKVNHELKASELFHFLKYESKPFEKAFDLIYLEHPEISAAIALLSEMNIFDRQLKRLREAFPYFAKVIKPNGRVIVACKTPDEAIQAQSLLQHLNTETKRMRFSWNLLFPRDYSHAALSTRSITLTARDQESKVTEIRSSTLLLVVFVVLATLLSKAGLDSGLNPFECSILFLFIGAQLITHRPEPKTCLNKSILALLQSRALTLFQENLIQKNTGQSSTRFSFQGV